MPFKFADNTKVETLDKVPEDFRSVYKEGPDGGFIVDEGHQKVANAFDGVGRALIASRTEAKTAKEKAIDLAGLSEYGTSVDEIAAGVKTKVDELTDQLAQGGQAKINLDKIKADLAKAHSIELTSKDTRIGALSGQLNKILVQAAATIAIAEAKGSPELLMPFVASQVKVIEEDGEMNVFVVDSAGDRRHSGVTGEAMTIKELVGLMKADEKYARLFDSEVEGGGGAHKGNKTVDGNKRPTGDDRSSVQKIADGLQKGQHKR